MSGVAEASLGGDVLTEGWVGGWLLVGGVGGRTRRYGLMAALRYASLEERF